MIGALIALVATAGDLAMLWVSNADRPDFAWLPRPPEGIDVVGARVGAVALLAYGVGYVGVARRLGRPADLRLIGLGIATGIVGASIHGLTGAAVHAQHVGGGPPTSPAEFLARHGGTLIPLWIVAAVLAIAASAVYATAVLQGASSLPRPMWAANPALLTVGLAAVGAATPLLRAFLVPAAPNVAHVLFFAAVAASPDLGKVLDTPRGARR